ncbi:MAG: hypothetical protein GY699_19595, partial [Desulfobacteraceae bacterium]|nr:hypothetical protein [Desulfobacteraceae bacterium]
MKKVIGGSISIILGLYYFSTYFSSFLNFLAGIVPLMLIIIGGLIIYLNYESASPDFEGQEDSTNGQNFKDVSSPVPDETEPEPQETEPIETEPEPQETDSIETEPEHEETGSIETEPEKTKPKIPEEYSVVGNESQNEPEEVIIDG